MVIETIAADPDVQRLRKRIATGKGVVHVSGLWGSAAPMLSAIVAQGFARCILYVTAHLEEADQARDDIEFFLDAPCTLFPAWETLPGEGAAAGEIEAERLRLCAAIVSRPGGSTRGGSGKTARAEACGSGGASSGQRPLPHGRGSERKDRSCGSGGASSGQRPLPHGRGSERKDRCGGSGEKAAQAEACGSGEKTAQAEACGSGEKTARAEACGSGERVATVIVAPIQALMQPVPVPAELRRHMLRLTPGEGIPGGGADAPGALLAWLIDGGYERLDLVESPGDVARRGDLVDVFAPGETEPIRVSFFDDRIESIRRFDVGPQRSTASLDGFTLTRARPPSVSGSAGTSRKVGSSSPAADDETDPDGDGAGDSSGAGVRGGRRANTPILLDLLSPDTLVVLDEPLGIQELGETLHRRLEHTSALVPVGEVLGRMEAFDGMHLSRFSSAGAAPADRFEFQVASLARWESPERLAPHPITQPTDAARGVQSLPSTLRSNIKGPRRSPETVDQPTAPDAPPTDTLAALCEAARVHAVHVVCDNAGERSRLIEMLQERLGGVPPSIHVHRGMIHRGFEWTPARTIVVSHHELFHRQRQRRRLRRLHAARPIESWLDLNPGDFVVHAVHGIGVYRELAAMRKGHSGQFEEFLTVEFAEGARVHVPVSQIDLVQKYIGAGGVKPRLSNVGGKRWGRTTDQVAQAVTDLAEELLRVQAARQNGAGTPYPPDTTWQHEFEASFPYEETEDQLTAADELRTDLMRPRPMDRLLCGDVGYGKTELAIRAAFKVVEYGRQVAVLVPTTVLAEQHHRTFADRMAEYPFGIVCLSRFRSPAEQRTIADRVRKGQVDIVIGTHRLLSKDIAFANLGLVIIDEEQRFGVEHKERLKAMRATVDLLTLTATPIPRTLHMAMMGLRDISTLQTPPIDRRAIATQVCTFEPALIRDAILRELNRDGQVYFVHNRVQSIAAVCDRLRAIVPEARFIYGHGQMRDEELESVMARFLNRDADVLVCTTIIESGIDIPRANTIFIDNADNFGLADLHQLRGRVGRSSHRAYCYLLTNPNRPIEPRAARRLKAVEEFSELGAGFRIAMRDLEIRGAGNLLGHEQSGHIASVGYEMYCRLLERAVRRLRNEPDPTPAEVHVDLDVSAHIPPHYIASGRARIDVYRRVAGARTVADIEQLEGDLKDAFGPFPPPVGRLLQLAELRVRARPFGIRSIRRQPPDVIFSVESVAAVEPVFADAPGAVRLPDGQTVHLRPPPGYLDPDTLLPVLRRMLARAAERSMETSA
jgi:transcription-repair coupling factor (superfamily II helicase)